MRDPNEFIVTTAASPSQDPLCMQPVHVYHCLEKLERVGYRKTRRLATENINTGSTRLAFDGWAMKADTISNETETRVCLTDNAYAYK
jgi:hypothetical protein